MNSIKLFWGGSNSNSKSTCLSTKYIFEVEWDRIYVNIVMIILSFTDDLYRAVYIQGNTIFLLVGPYLRYFQR